jgi:glucose-6-phosphate isomerase
MLTLDTSPTQAKTITANYGIPDSELTALRNPMKKYIDEYQSEREKGNHPWADTVYDSKGIERMKEVLSSIPLKRIRTVIWIGIGGSSLGPKVLKDAFESEKTVEFLVVDTIDPYNLSAIIESLDWKRTLLVVASKSGGTLEPMSTFHLFWQELKKKRKHKASKQCIAITDPKQGELRSFCINEDIPILSIAEGIGGRYSIFSPIGLLPMMLLKKDVEAFLQGAMDMDESTLSPDLNENPAALLACVQFLLETRRNLGIRVIMPYIQRLAEIGRWNQQLIAESLGKEELRSPIPVASIGTQDQHSLLQQWMAGPRKQFHLFIREEEEDPLHVPDIEGKLSYLSKKNFSTLLSACYEGTTSALTSAKRPHATISIPEANEYSVGQLFFFFMAEVIFLGKLHRIDPYGQPAVEIGKIITKEILTKGRKK